MIGGVGRREGTDRSVEIEDRERRIVRPNAQSIDIYRINE